MVIPPLRRKVLRDLRRLWAQVLAIALVMAAGVATLILGNGAYASLHETRARYYQDYRFADVFADVTRAPRALLAEIERIEGVLDAEARIVKLGQLDLPGMAEPGAVLLVSLPVADGGGLNRLYLRQGRLPDTQSASEVVVSAPFAAAHRLGPGDTLPVLMNGRWRALRITGVALSPEFIYALGPGEIMPDPRRFGIVWAPRAALEAAFDLEGAFSNVVLKLAPGASPAAVIDALDRLTARYGGVGATGRDDQTSHAFLDAELRQLSAMAKILPPIFLLVAAMLVNMTLARLIALEREQIGLLKAIGYSSRAVAQHYVEFVLLIALVGVLVGCAAGAWLGAGMARMYARFFSFPFLVFTRDAQLFALAGLVTLSAAVAGALQAVRSVVRLPPAVAMAPPAPAVYRRRLGWLARRAALRQTGVMVVRHLLRWPVRTLSSTLGLAMAVAILAASLWSFGSIDHMVDVTFFRSERQDAVMVFGDPAPGRSLFAGRQLPGVLVAEPFRTVAARISHRTLSKRLAIVGRPAGAQLSRVLDPDLIPIDLPEAGLVLSEALADALQVGPGDLVTVEVLEGIPAHGQPAGQRRLAGLCRPWRGDGDRRAEPADGRRRRGLGPEPADRSGRGHRLLRRRKGRAPHRGRHRLGPDPRALSPDAGREHHGDGQRLCQPCHDHRRRRGLQLLAHRPVGTGRELASLRVLGFTRGEVAGVLFGELAVVVVLAQPLGWLIGNGIGRAMVAAFSSDLYRVPFVMGPEVYATASLVVLAAALVSAFAIRARINRLDLIEVLKTRE